MIYIGLSQPASPCTVQNYTGRPLKGAGRDSRNCCSRWFHRTHFAITPFLQSLSMWIPGGSQQVRCPSLERIWINASPRRYVEAVKDIEHFGGGETFMITRRISTPRRSMITRIRNCRRRTSPIRCFMRATTSGLPSNFACLLPTHLAERLLVRHSQ